MNKIVRTLMSQAIAAETSCSRYSNTRAIANACVTSYVACDTMKRTGSTNKRHFSSTPLAAKPLGRRLQRRVHLKEVSNISNVARVSSSPTLPAGATCQQLLPGPDMGHGDLQHSQEKGSSWYVIFSFLIFSSISMLFINFP